MNDRISRLEGAQEGLKQSQSILVGSIAVVAALLIGAIAVVAGLEIYGLQKTDTQISAVSDQISKTHDQVIALPAQIETRLQNVANTLSAAITASKERAPQVILMQAPAANTTGQAPPPSK